MGTRVPSLPTGKSEPAHSSSNRRVRGAQQKIRPCPSRPGDTSTVKWIPTPPHCRRSLYALASGHPHPRHFCAGRRRRLRIRMDRELRSSLYNYIRQGIPILFSHLPAADEDLGHTGRHDSALSPGSQRHGGALPPSTKGGADRPGLRRTREVVLEAANGAVGHPHNSETRHRRLTLGPRVWRRPGSARGSPPEGSIHGSTARPTTRDGSL